MSTVLAFLCDRRHVRDEGNTDTEEEGWVAAAIAVSLEEEGNQASNTKSPDRQGEVKLPTTWGRFAAPGSHEAQDQAFFSSLPLSTRDELDAGAARGGRRVANSKDSGNRSSGGRASASTGSDGGVFGTQSPNPIPLGGSGYHERTRTQEDEALARTLQEHFISEELMRVQSGTTRQIAEDLELAQLLRKQDPADAGGGWKGAPKCQDCNQPLGVGPWRHVMGKDYHRDCFKCKGCGWAIRERVFDLSQGEAFHRSCLPPSNVPTCKVCHEQLPVEQGVYHFHRHAMFDEKYCPWHQDRQTAVVDSSEAGPAFADVCDFLETDLGLIVPPDMRVVPVLVVDSPTLNEHSSRDTNTNTNTLETHTRGLTLSEVCLGQSRAVTAILVLCGLPYSSFTSILAHEAMHAWMKLTHSFPWGLPAQVEEGVCQLVAYLWLVHLAGKLPEDEQAQEGGEPSANQLREFFVHQIETDISPVYGDGYRMAKRAYDEVGLEALLSHIAEHKSFPLL